MKTKQKTAAIIALFFIIPALAFSQDEDTVELVPTGHEIYAGYGYPNSLGTKFVNGMADIFSIIFSGGSQSIKTTGPGVVQLGYNYIFQNGFSVGGFFTYEPYTLDYVNINNSAQNRHSKQTVFTIQATAKYQYGWKYARLYHGVSAGVSILADFDEDTAGAAFTLNIIPIGVKVGLEKGINFYADVGLWSSPLINAGLSYRF